MKRRQSGFTLIELMVALLVLSILMAVAVPSFREVTRNNRVVAAQNDLVTALNFARSEAIKRSATIEVCASNNGTDCSGALSWSNGWLVRVAPGGAKLQAWGAIEGGVTATGSVNQLVYQPTGTVDTSATFDVLYPGCTGKRLRRITVLLMGSPASETRSCAP